MVFVISMYDDFSTSDVITWIRGKGKEIIRINSYEDVAYMFKYHGEDTAANGLCLRMDIHQLFDCGELRLKPDGVIVLTERARLSYGYSIPPDIRIPPTVNLDFVRWRWDNYNGY